MFVSRLYNHINFLKRITSSALSSIIMASGFLLIFKYYHIFNNHELIYIYNWGQVISGIFVILIIYGAKFEISEEIIINIRIPIILSIAIFLFFPVFGLSLLLFIKIYQQKMGVQTSSSQVIALFILLILSTLYILVDNNMILAVIVLLSLLPATFSRENCIRIPKVNKINFGLVIGIVKRSSLDLSLIFPILTINYFTKKYFSINEFIEISQLLFCLNVLSIVTSVLEKIVFDSSLLSKFRDNKKIYIFLLVFFTYIAVVFLGFFFEIRTENWWYLAIMPLINLKFAFELSKTRSMINSRTGMIISFSFFIAFLISAVIGVCIYKYIGNPFQSVTVATALLAISQIYIIMIRRSMM
jgi:hypothetical protein